MAQIIAIDWSGRERGDTEYLWTAVVRDGQLMELENGRQRGAAIDYAIELASSDDQTILGLDFAFSFPQWYCEQEEWSSGRDVWWAMSKHGEKLLHGCKPPFWGRTGTTAQRLGDGLRATEHQIPARAKSVFQISGAGAVGTGSLRGMPHLLALSREGFSVWPFEAPRLPVVVEIYPRLFTGRVNKSRHRDRREHLEKYFGDQSPVLRERAAGSEDAFDAAVSALVMSSHLDELKHLPDAVDDQQRIEGAIWFSASHWHEVTRAD